MGVLESILSFISTIGTFISNLVLSLYQGLLMLVNAVILPQQVMMWVTPFLGSCVVVVGAIAVIKLIIGWGNS